ncbi:thiocillin family RiPP [Streptomyces roseoverticillatus]
MNDQTQIADEDIAVEELDEVSGGSTLGTGSTIACPAGTAATFGSH